MTEPIKEWGSTHYFFFFFFLDATVEQANTVHGVILRTLHLLFKNELN